MSKGKEKLKESLSALMDNEASESEEKRPDLLSRINAELDGIDRIEGPDTNSSTSDASNHAESRNAVNSNHFAIFNGSFKRLGQGAIAASVAAIVLIAGGSLNSSVPLETEFQLAEQSELAEDNVPKFDDDYFPSEFSRVPQLNTEVAGTESTDEAARVRLRQAVFQEFVGEPQESLELPVNFNVIIEEE